MSPWQVLRAGRATQAALGYRVHHGPGGSVHYSTAPAAPAAPGAPAVAPDGSRSFCLSQEKLTMQQLNRRLAAYLQQVQCLEAANQRLECQIQRELDRKCPKELKQLDGHLRTVSMLQDQISECLSAQAQVKLQLLSAELTIFDLNMRFEKERERRGCLEAELGDLRLLEEELQVHRLPELQSLLNDQTQQMMGLQIQHQQDMQDLLAQMSLGVTVEMQPAESLDMIQQLNDHRQTSVMLFDKNQNECSFNTQVSMLSSPEVTFGPPEESDIIQAELEELRRTAMSLEEEVTQMQALNKVLEASGVEQNESFVQQLVVLQQKADGLCSDLDSVLQAAVQQASDYQTLLDIKTRLETEIEDYKCLLDGLSSQGVSSLHPKSAATSFCVTMSPSTFRRNITVNKTINVQGGNLRKVQEVQPVSRDHIHSVGQTPVFGPLSETMTTPQSMSVYSKHPKNLTVTSINTSNLTGSFYKSENQRTGAVPDRSGRESMTMSTITNRQSIPVEDKVHFKNHDMQNTLIVTTQITQGLDKESVVKETNTTQEILMLVPDTQSTRSTAVQAKPETFSSRQTTTEVSLQAKAETKILTEIPKTILCTEPEEKKGPHSAVSGSDILRSEEVHNKVSGDSTLIDVKDIKRHEKKGGEELVEVDSALSVLGLDQSLVSDRSATVQPKSETLTSKQTTTEADLQANITETNIQTVITKTIICAEPEIKQGTHFVTHMAVTDPSKQTAAEVKKETETVISAQMDCTEGSIEAKHQDPGQVVSLSLETPTETVLEEEELAVTASCVSGSVMEDADTGSDIVTASSSGPDNNDDIESKSVQAIIPLVPDTQSAMSTSVPTKPETFTSKQSTTEADLQANIETNIQTAITKTILCAEQVIKHEPHFVKHTDVTDPSKKTAAEVKKETETVISAQMDCIEGPIEAKHQDPAQVVSLSLETPTEAVEDAGEVAVTVSVVTGSDILRSEEAHGKVSSDVTLMDNKDIERQEKKGEEEVGSTSPILRLDQSSALSDASSSEQNKVMEGADTGSDIATASSSGPDNNDNLESKTAQAIPLVPDTQSATSATVQAKPETFTSKQTTTEADLQIKIQTEVKHEPHVATQTTAADLSKQTAAELKKETETVISVQMDCTEGSEAKHQDPVQVVSLSLETPTEAVEDAGGVAVTVSVVSGSQALRSEEIQNNVLTLTVDKDIERQENKGDEVLEVEGALPADTGSGITTASFSSPSRNDNLESKTMSTEILKTAEVEVNKEKRVNGFHDTNEVKVDPTESDNKINLAGQEASSSTTKSGKSTSLTDSGVALSFCDPDELLSSMEAHVVVSPTKLVTCLSPCLNPDETEVLMSMTDQVFRPVDPEEHIRSPDLPLSPNDPEMFLSPNDSDTCLSPVEDKVNPNGEEEEDEDEVCLSLTEAKSDVRPVEKYILSTKEEGQSFSRDQALPEDDKNRNVNVSVKDGESMCFGSFEGNKGNRGTGGTGALANEGPTSGSVASDLATRSGGTAANLSGTISANEKPATTVGLQGRFRRDSGEWMVYGGVIGQKSSLDGSPRLPSEGKGESPPVAMNRATSPQETGRFGSKGSGEWMVYSGRKSSLTRTRSEERPSVTPATNPPESRKLGSGGSGEFIVYGGSLKRSSSLVTSDSLPNRESKESLPMATHPSTTSPGTRTFGSRGSGEWRVYGGSSGRISSWAGSNSLPTADREEIPSVAAQLPTSPPGSLGGRRLGSGGSGEWRVYGGSSGRISSWAGSKSLPTADGEEIPSVPAQLPTSPPGSIGAGKFGSRGSGEWRVYGGSTGRISSWAGSKSLPNADGEEIPSVPAQLPTSPPGSQGGGRFGSGGSGEWRVYGGSTGRLSSASSADRVSVSANQNRIISPPSSLTSSGRRLGSTGSGSRLSSGSVVRRSSSVGSGGRLSSSGSGGRLSSSSGNHRTSTSGRVPSTGSIERKPVYSSANARKSSVGSAGRSGGGGAISSQRAPSPGGRMTVNMGSGGWINSSTASGSHISNPGSGSNLSSSGGSDRGSSRAGGRISSSSGSGRTNSTGGRVISSSDRPIRSTGSGAGGSKERISVCKMAALSISAAGRERSQDRQGQRSQKQQGPDTSPLLQRWLSTGGRVTSPEPGGLDDITRL